jgi:adenylate cyclase
LKQNLPRIVLALLLVGLFLAHATSILRIGAIDRLDQAIYDARLRATMPNTPDPRIVILDIDEKSLEEEGHWPWGRDKLARILDKLFTLHKIAILGFDVVWAEKDTSSGLAHLEELAQGELKGDPAFLAQLDKLRPTLDFDQLFADAIHNRPVVLGYFFTGDREQHKSGLLPEPALPAGIFNNRPIQIFQWDGYGANLPSLQKVALAAGHFNPVEDNDGTVRRVPMLVEFEGNYYESLSLAVMRALLGSPGIRPGYPDDAPWLPRSYSGLESLDLPIHGKGILRVPVDRNVATLVPYRGRGFAAGGSFRYISLTDVLHDRVPAGALKDKIVLVGTSALGLVDQRATPVSEVYPGVEVHANLISGMLDGNIKEAPDYTLGAEVVMLLLVGLLLGLALPFLSVVRAVILSLVLALLLVAFNLFAYTQANLVLPLSSSLLLLTAIFAINMIYGYFIESRGKRELAGLFGSYVPPKLVEEMSRDPRAYNMEGRSEELTVMFADVRGFTTISESLKPKDLSEYINEYLTSMSLIIQNHRGTLDKYIGDAIMAFWGAPVAEARHAQLAVETAIEMQGEVARVNERFRARSWPDMQIGIGVSTGVMSVGDMGSKIRLAYTVMGDAVNLGSRLEGVTKTYGVGIIVSEASRKAVAGIVFRELDRIRVKGKDEPIAIFEPIGREGEVEQSKLDELKLWHQTLKVYRAQQWDQAELQLLNLQKLAPGTKLYVLFGERIGVYRQSPPPENWGGVTNFTEK